MVHHQGGLIEHAITPNELHFIRNHGGIPEIDEDAYFFDIDGLVNNPKRLTLKDLKNEDLFPRQSNIVTIQCSGTRRIEQIALYPGEGDELINAPVGDHPPSYFPLRLGVCKLIF